MTDNSWNGITRRQASIGIAAACLASRAAWAATPADNIDSALRASVARKEIPGVVAMAADRNGILYRGAFGVADVTTGRAMCENDLFRIASMTKAVTSTAAMQLIEQGKLALEDPVQKYLPEFAKAQEFVSFDAATGAYRLKPVTRPVTVRHLLTHTSGLGYNFTSAIVRDFKPKEGETYPVGPLLFEPGTRWHYGTSTDQVGRLVETVSGDSLESYFRAKIFAPLGMNDTAYNVPKDKEARLVAVHRRQTGGEIVKDVVQPPPMVARPIGGGGLASTASDYIRFTRMILNDGTLDGARILKPESVAAMSRNQIGAVGVPALKTAMPERSADFSFVADGSDKWGLGFLIAADAVAGKRSAGSLSWGGINNTYFWIDRTRGISGVILMQFLPFADPQALALHDQFERGVYRLKPA
ncbi:MAG: class A beta-lactamase-related serine hydrolase [Alphaproteobacteria bacterium]|nr:class A beta-lactamase-related serine hydrolase [Alphaproteobacteria bacterium]